MCFPQELSPAPARPTADAMQHTVEREHAAAGTGQLAAVYDDVVDGFVDELPDVGGFEFRLDKQTDSGDSRTRGWTRRHLHPRGPKPCHGFPRAAHPDTSRRAGLVRPVFDQIPGASELYDQGANSSLSWRQSHAPVVGPLRNVTAEPDGFDKSSSGHSHRSAASTPLSWPPE
jgi:hypothetical protein